ncbi:MAG: putative membrane protein YfcA [Gammaproteobacteria bacterium]
MKGISGLGIPLVGISLLSLLIPVPQAIALLPIPIIVVNVWQVMLSGNFLGVCRQFAPLLVAMCVGTVIGTALLASIDVTAMLLFVGCVVTLFALSELAQLRVRIPPHLHQPAGGLAGFLGGVMGGLSSIFGPPILMYLLTLKMSKDEFVRTICTIYLISGIALAVTLGAFGVAGVHDLKWSALATVPLLLGVYVGQFARKTDQRSFVSARAVDHARTHRSESNQTCFGLRNFLIRRFLTRTAQWATARVPQV